MLKSLLSLIMFLGPVSAQADPFDVYGLWLTEVGDAHIEVMDCGDKSPCGTLTWVDTATTVAASDARNANKALRERPLIGVPIVWSYERGKKGWRRGHIYNPEDGKTFNSTMRLQPDGTLKVQGCLGPICITNIWTPIPQQMEAF